MISINTNYGGLFASKAASESQRTLDTAMERLSSGMRINYAKDDAAGQAISTRLTAEVQGLEMASRNAADAQSMIDTAEGALQETHTLLLRMRELSVQAANGVHKNSDLTALDAEASAMISEINRIDANTTWAGKALFDDSTKTFQVGVNNTSNDKIAVTIGDMSHTSLFSGSVDLSTQSKAQTTIGVVDIAIGRVSAERGKLGAVSNRLSSTMANLDQVAVNLSASKGRIQDTDFAQETGNLAKNQILQQAATAMLAQANASKSSVLTLIRN
jgi:flagellin